MDLSTSLGWQFGNYGKGSRLNVFVLIDALGWEIIKERSFLNAELPIRQPLKTVLGYSSGAIPTILTGLPPAQNGHWNMLYYDPNGSPFRWLRWLSFLPDGLVDNRVSRKLIKELGRRLLGMGPLFECCVSPGLLAKFNWVEKLNIYAEGGIPNSVSIFDTLRRRAISYRSYSYHTRTDAEIVRQAGDDIQSANIEFLFIYLSEFDRFLHGYRDNSAAVTERLAWYDHHLREVFNVAIKTDPEASFTIVSDHGMTEVHSRYDLLGKIDGLGFKMPKDYLAVYDSTMARFWFFNPAARASVVSELEETSCGRIVDDEELERLGILFSDRRYGEVIFLLDPGWLMARSDFNGDHWKPVGMHGFHPSDRDSDAIFLSNRLPRHQMRSIIDIYNCMEEVVLKK